jgi:hypothetical protein
MMDSHHERIMDEVFSSVKQPGSRLKQRQEPYA